MPWQRCCPWTLQWPHEWPTVLPPYLRKIHRNTSLTPRKLKFGGKGGSDLTPDVYAREYLKRGREVGVEEAEGPKRPRRMRLDEGAYTETKTKKRARRDQTEGAERKIRRSAMVPVGREALKRMEKE